MFNEQTYRKLSYASHVFSARPTVSHSQLVHTSLAHIRPHGSPSHPYMELWEGPRAVTTCEKGFPELSERWRVHSAGVCGGETETWQRDRHSSRPDGDVGTWCGQVVLLLSLTRHRSWPQPKLAQSALWFTDLPAAEVIQVMFLVCRQGYRSWFSQQK